MANTTAPLSETAIATMAAGLLDEYSIVDLDDNHPLVRFMAREFGYVRDEVLQTYPWSFALEMALLTADPTPPAFRWSYRYNLPDDCLRLLPLTEEGKLDGCEIPHERIGRMIHTNYTGITGGLPIMYVKRFTTISRWSPLAARAFAARMAMYASTRVTGKMNYYAKAAEEYARVLFEAQQADSLERGTTQKWGLDGPYNSITVRGVLR